MKSVAVLGAGGVGGFLAAALQHGGGVEVTVVAREPTAQVLSARGIVVHSRLLGDFVARPATATTLAAEADVLFIATKADGLRHGLKRIATSPSLVIPLLNGTDHLAPIRDRFGADAVPAAVIRIESDRPTVGVIEQTSPGARIDVASERPALTAKLPGLAELMGASGIGVRIETREADVMWSKLTRLCTLALTTSASGQPIGFIRSDAPWRVTMERVVAEVVAVARAEGAHLEGASTIRELDSAPELLSSSMQRDLVAGRPPELDAIAGAVLRAAQRHGLVCPTVRRLAEAVAERSAQAGACHPQHR